jgi:DNA-binding CsgD family transcriptional regulator/tetratricopeptide (TPR) repeat protein
VTRCPVLVGRDGELQLLMAALDAAAGGSGGLVVLTGAPGAGKSRLLRELAGRAPGAGFSVAFGRASGSTRAGPPFAALTEALLHARRAHPDVELDVLGAWARALVDVLPVHGGESVIAGEMSPVVRAEAVVRLVGRLSRSAPLLIGLEDLHWADPDTLDVVGFLAEGLRNCRVLCVATIRSERASAALDLARYASDHVELGAFAPAQVRQMARACRADIGDAELDAVVERAEGLPLLVEELLAAPGMPPSLAESVRTRLSAIGVVEQHVLACAAVLGRRFDWRLLAVAAGVDVGQVRDALERGVSDQLLDFTDEGYFFRHALTRDAVLDTLLPHVRAELALGALRAVAAQRAEPHEANLELLVGLARQAGLPERAARLLCESGRAALRRGALATAVNLLRDAAALARDDRLRRDVYESLVDALAQAGRLDECLSAAAELLAMQSPAESVATHLALALAAIEATRWPLAAAHLTAAEQLLPEGTPGTADRWRVLRAELLLNAGAFEDADVLARAVLASDEAPAETRCHAFALLGRNCRTRDLAAAAQAFADSLACAEAAGLPMWRLRATHELGTIELFDHAGIDGLQRARDLAEQVGALSTGVVIDIQLAAAHLFRFDVDRCAAHAASALVTAEAIRTDQLRAIALVFLAEAASLRGDVRAMERYNGQAMAAAPGDAEIEGSVWGARGVAALLAGHDVEAERALGRAEQLLRPLSRSGPAIYRGLWLLLRAVRGEQGAHHDIAIARAIGIEVNRGNRGLLLLAEAALADHRRDEQRAGALAEEAVAPLAPFGVWADLGWLLVAGGAPGAASAQGRQRLSDAARAFRAHGLDVLATRCETLLSRPGVHPLAPLGVTPRELEILALVATGLSNREIAAQLTVSPRTVEKHVESLLRKTGTTSRTQLVAVAATSAPQVRITHT